MVCSLIANVSDSHLLCRYSNAKCAITFLPLERAHVWKCLMNPFGRVSLQKLDRFGHGNRGRQRNQNMYVIRDPTDCKWPNFVFPRYAAQIGPKALTYIRSQKRRAILCTPDAMNETTIERMHAFGPSVPAGTLSVISRDPSVETLGYLRIAYFHRTVY